MTIDLRGTRKFYYLTAILLLAVSVWLLLSDFTPVQAADDAPVESVAVTKWHERAGAEKYQSVGAKVSGNPKNYPQLPAFQTPTSSLAPTSVCSQCEPAGLPLNLPANKQIYVTCRFRDPSQLQHSGLDFPIDKYTEIAATHDGVVVVAEYDPVYGNLVVIENQPWKTRYAHASYLLVRTGDPVQAGDVIALVGSTGSSSGDHLHYEVRDARDTPRNPEKYIDMTQVKFAPCTNDEKE